ncbi:prenyltransferase/squalene oxidase [Neisseria mucosa C102]|uniref:Prenyltransferase/squalene oxidase n=1 Tax=Neisseria mucosa C102 TaxID=435832 RepID=A0ABP2KEK4_NEIMU|nr:prenyltransferase/squalene oxidase [Neisseria mucosa C102]
MTMTFVSTHSRLKAAGKVERVVQSVKVVSTHSRLKAAGASLKSLATSSFANLISLSTQEKREREYNTAFSVTPAFTIS